MNLSDSLPPLPSLRLSFSIFASPTRIVGFYVEPLSINHKTSVSWDGKGDAPSVTTCPSKNKHLTYDNVKGNPQKVALGNVLFTYDVQWRESDIKWASRWDVYLSMDHAVPDKVHWFSIVNSILIVLFLAVIVAMILIRSLHRDISHYNRVSLNLLFARLYDRFLVERSYMSSSSFRALN